MNKSWWKSSTIGGTLLAGLSVIASPDVLALVPAKFAWVGVVIGAVAAQVGLRQAIAKNGAGH